MSVPFLLYGRCWRLHAQVFSDVPFSLSYIAHEFRFPHFPHTLLFNILALCCLYSHFNQNAAVGTFFNFIDLFWWLGFQTVGFLLWWCDGLFLTCKDLGECLTIDFLPAVFFFKVVTSSCTLIPLFRSESVYSGSASWDNCDQVFPDELHVSSFPDRFPHYAWTMA